MLFKPIDPQFVLSDTFKNWPLETKATFTVCAALGNYFTGEFHHATATIANHANISGRAVRRSLRRMEAAEQLTINGQRKRSFVYNFAAAVTTWLKEQKEKKRREAEDAAAEADGQQTLDLTVTYRTGESDDRTRESHYRTGESVKEFDNSEEETPQTPAITDENQERHESCSLFLTTEERTTTEQIAADAVADKLVQQMVTKHSSEDVVVVLSAMGSMMKSDPDCFDNPSAYFRRCCENGWIPTNKSIQETEKRNERKARVREEQERSRQEHDEMKRRIAQEQNDPEVMARIKAVQAEFLNGMSTPSQSIKDQVAVN